MLGKVRLLASLAIRLARLTQRQVKNEVARLVKAGVIKRSDVKTVARLLKRELVVERARVAAFAKTEAKREVKNVVALARVLASRSKRFVVAHGIKKVVRRKRAGMRKK